MIKVRLSVITKHRPSSPQQLRRQDHPPLPAARQPLLPFLPATAHVIRRARSSPPRASSRPLLEAHVRLAPSAILIGVLYAGNPNLNPLILAMGGKDI